MPYSAKDAKRHTKKADTPKKQRQWAHIFNSVMERTGSESAAFKAASGTVKKAGKKPARRKAAKKKA